MVTSCLDLPMGICMASVVLSGCVNFASVTESGFTETHSLECCILASTHLYAAEGAS